MTKKQLMTILYLADVPKDTFAVLKNGEVKPVKELTDEDEILGGMHPVKYRAYKVFEFRYEKPPVTYPIREYYIYRARIRGGSLEGFHKIQANYAWCRPNVLTEVPYSALVKEDGSYWILKDGKETEVSEEEALTHVLEEDMDYRMDYPF